MREHVPEPPTSKHYTMIYYDVCFQLKTRIYSSKERDSRNQLLICCFRYLIQSSNKHSFSCLLEFFNLKTTSWIRTTNLSPYRHQTCIHATNIHFYIFMVWISSFIKRVARLTYTVNVFTSISIYTTTSLTLVMQC